MMPANITVPVADAMGQPASVPQNVAAAAAGPAASPPPAPLPLPSFVLQQPSSDTAKAYVYYYMNHFHGIWEKGQTKWVFSAMWKPLLAEIGNVRVLTSNFRANYAHGTSIN
jgi:hypothetical protein